MLALKIRRHLEEAWRSIEITVEEGLQHLEQMCVMELVHKDSQQVMSRIVAEGDDLTKQLIDALNLTLPETIPAAKVNVGTRVKINKVR